MNQIEKRTSWSGRQNWPSYRTCWAMAIVLIASLGCSPVNVSEADAGRVDSAEDGQSDANTHSDALIDHGYDLGGDSGSGFCACDDGDPETTDACCDDADPITDDSCRDGGCVHLDNCARCDDGDPSTENLCLSRFCLFFEEECRPGVASVCNDDLAVTEDGCETVGRTVRCTHRLLPGFCVSEADCTAATDNPCLASPRCTDSRCAYDVVPDCDVRSQQIPDCPNWAVAGGPCVEPAAPDTISVCLRDADITCPVRLACNQDVVSPGGPRFYEVVAASCDPRCGASPAHGASCDVNVQLGCDYSPNTDQVVPIDFNSGEGVTNQVYEDGYDPPQQPVCVCTPQGTQTCTFDCPVNPPRPGETSILPGPNGQICYYDSLSCNVRPTLTPEQGYPWVCESLDTFICPSEPPTGPNVSCNQLINSVCRFQRMTEDEPVTTYTGTCTCESSNLWSCTPSESADCPPSPPDAGSTCERTQGNQRCVYPATLPAMEERCRCSGLNTWICGIF